MLQNKKALCLFVIIFYCLIFAVWFFFDSQAEISVGMTYADFTKSVPEDRFFEYLEYGFSSDRKGNLYVVRFENEKIAEYQVFKSGAIDKSADTFSSIPTGTSIFELVRLIGLPVGTGTFGMPSLLFESGNGDCYIVYLDTTDPHNLCVAEIALQD